MTRLEYKMTEIGEMPEEWRTSELRKIFKIITGTTPSTKIKKYWTGGTLEWLTPKDLSQMNDNLIISPSERKVTTEALNESNLNLLPEGSILISTRAPVGYVGINRAPITFNQGCKGLVPLVSEDYSSFFYAYYLKYKREFLNSVSSGSTFKELSKERLERLVIPIPPRLEQQKIAEILSTADETIRKVNEEITPTEKLKKGLMQTLLTKGIGHTKFKITEIGEIPEDWKIANIRETTLLKGRIGWQGLTTKEYLKIGKYYLVTGTEFKDGAIDWRQCNFVSKERYEQDPNIQLKINDILITKDGTIGKLAFVNSITLPATLNSGVFVLRPFNNSYHPKFFFFILQSQYFKKFINTLKVGSTISHLYQYSFTNFTFPNPPLLEQHKIAEILTTVDHKLELLRNKKTHLEELKKGLMENLLTGRVRVKV